MVSEAQERLKTYRVTFTWRFRADLNNIVQTIAEEAGGVVARRWNTRIMEQARGLRNMPQRGAVTEWNGFRRLVVAPYLIFYRVLERDRVEIVRVLDGRRDLEQLLIASSLGQT